VVVLLAVIVLFPMVVFGLGLVLFGFSLGDFLRLFKLGFGHAFVHIAAATLFAFFVDVIKLGLWRLFLGRRLFGRVAGERWQADEARQNQRGSNEGGGEKTHIPRRSTVQGEALASLAKKPQGTV